MNFISKFRNLYHSSRQNLTLVSSTLKTPRSYTDDALKMKVIFLVKLNTLYGLIQKTSKLMYLREIPIIGY